MSRWFCLWAFVTGFSLAFLVVELWLTIKEERDAARRQAEADYMAALQEDLGGVCRAVVWRKNQFEQSGMYGRVDFLDEDTLTIDDGYEFVILRRQDILEMH